MWDGLFPVRTQFLSIRIFSNSPHLFGVVDVSRMFTVDLSGEILTFYI